MEKLRNAPGQFKDLPAARKELLEKFLLVEHEPERSATIQATVFIATARGINLAAPDDKKIDVARLEEAIAAHMSDTVDAMRPLVFALNASAYVSLSDRELEQYIAFEGSAAQQRVSEAMVAALRQAIAEAGVNFGLGLTQQDWSSMNETDRASSRMALSDEGSRLQRRVA